MVKRCRSRRRDRTIRGVEERARFRLTTPTRPQHRPHLVEVPSEEAAEQHVEQQHAGRAAEREARVVGHALLHARLAERFPVDAVAAHLAGHGRRRGGEREPLVVERVRRARAGDARAVAAAAAGAPRDRPARLGFGAQEDAVLALVRVVAEPRLDPDVERELRHEARGGLEREIDGTVVSQRRPSADKTPPTRAGMVKKQHASSLACIDAERFARLLAK